MTTPTITWQSIDIIAERLMGSDVTGTNYYGDRPCLPADALIAVCRKLSAQTKPQP
jgi:hypothetical protein